jgi:transposase
MRPACVFANPPHTAACAQIRTLLRGRYRVALRLLMIWFSLQDWPPAQIAALLGYHPATVRRPIDRYNTEGIPGLADRPRSGAPRLGSPHLPMRIRRLLAIPCAWTIARIWRALGRPALSLRTLYRRLARTGPLAPPPPDRQTRPRCRADLRRHPGRAQHAAPGVGGAAPRMKAMSTCCPGYVRPGSCAGCARR